MGSRDFHAHHTMPAWLNWLNLNLNKSEGQFHLKISFQLFLTKTVSNCSRLYQPRERVVVLILLVRGSRRHFSRVDRRHLCFLDRCRIHHIVPICATEGVGWMKR